MARRDWTRKRTTCSEAGAVEGADRALDDIEAVTAALIAQPFVDGSRIAVGGHARGGTLSVAWSGNIPRCELSSISSAAGSAGLAGTVAQSTSISRSAASTGGSRHFGSMAPGISILPLEDSKANFDTFLTAGGKAVWHDYKPPEEKWNGHEIGQMPQLWTADMEAYLAERGLPAKVR